MADDTPDIVVGAVDWSDVGYQVFNGFIKRWLESTAAQTIPGTLAEGEVAVKHASFEAMVFLASMLGDGLVKLEEPVLPIIAAFIVPIIQGIFGGSIDIAALRKQLDSGAAQAGAKSIVDGFLKAVTGDGTTEVAPGTEGAQRVATAAVQASLQSTFNAIIPELLSDIIPFEMGHFTAFTDLPKEIIRTLGVSRLVRRALTPYITATCVTPATWSLNKQYRPHLLGASTLAKLIAKTPASADKWREDLRRDGYSDERIDALLAEQLRYLGAVELELLVYRGELTAEKAYAQLQQQGYESEAAVAAIHVETIKRIDAREAVDADAIKAAYVAGDIDRGTMTAAIVAAVANKTQQDSYIEEADLRRACSLKQLTLADGAAMVKSGVLAYADYRAIAERLNYVPSAVDALDLQLRAEVDKQTSIAQHKAAQAAEKAAAAAAAAAAKAAKLAAAQAKEALAERGSEKQLEDAAIRGLIPMTRVQEVYDAKYDSDTVQILMDDLATKRQAYIDQQQKAADAAKRAAVKAISIGSYETAVLNGVLTVDQYRSVLTAAKIAAGDVDVLVATVQAKLDAKTAAETLREQAKQKAAVKHIDLAQFELLVRRGHRTMGEYQQFLSSLGYDAGSVAAMAELLQVHIDDDAKAAALKATAAQQKATKGLTLGEVERAIILGTSQISMFVPWLLQHGYNSQDATILLAELQAETDAAAAARARRAAADRAVQAGRAPLADVRRAARLGLIPIAAYMARLTADGYTADDLALEQDLLLNEIGAHKAQLAAAAAAEAASTVKGLTLAELDAAVMAGAAPIAEYTARALAIGLSPADAQTLTATLQDKLDATAALRTRKAELAADDATREVKRADVETAVKDGLKTFDDYQAWLTENGYADDDVALLVAELHAKLGK